MAKSRVDWRDTIPQRHNRVGRRVRLQFYRPFYYISWTGREHILNHLDTLTADQGHLAQAFYDRHPDHIPVDIRRLISRRADVTMFTSTTTRERRARKEHRDVEG